MERLVASPGIGSPVETKKLDIAGVRKWPVERFPRMLIFYIVHGDNLDIIRLLHAASDWQAALDAD